MPDVQYIRDFIPGNALQIQRKIANPGKPSPVVSVSLYVVSWSNVTLLEKTVYTHPSRIDPPPDDGWILNSGNSEPFVLVFRINLFAHETEKLRGNPNYLIKVTTASDTYSVEIGRFIPGDPAVPVPKGKPSMILAATEEVNFVASELVNLFQELLDVTTTDETPLPPPPSPALPLPVPGEPGYVSATSYTTYSDACETVAGREVLIIDGFLDAILGDYRQLKVWDEHARRTANNFLKLRLTYEYLNKYTTPELFDGNNNPVGFDQVDFDFRNGVFSVAGDNGKQDYFCTYTFNFFPEKILRMFVDQTVMEMNFIGSANGGFTTHYTKLEETPPSWDGVIALGAAAKAWKRLATHTVLWRNWLIFEGDRGEGVDAPGGAAAQQAANDAATFYQTQFESYAAGTKYEKYVIPPTDTWLLFANTGFGSYGPMGPGNQVITNSKFRGLTVNKSGSYVY